MKRKEVQLLNCIDKGNLVVDLLHLLNRLVLDYSGDVAFEQVEEDRMAVSHALEIVNDLL